MTNTPIHPTIVHKTQIAAALLLATGLAMVAGCGTSLTEVAIVAESPAIRATINSTTNFGDSITCAVGASVPDNGYAYLLDASIGKPYENYCRPGDQAADMARLWVYPKTTPTTVDHQLYTVLIGTNDAYFCGSASGCIANWYQSLESSLAWIAMPSKDKILASNCTMTAGTWTSDLTNGLATTTNGASLSFVVTQTIANRNLYVAYRVFDSASTNPATATMTVDGTRVAILSSAVLTGQTISTNNHTTDTIIVSAVNLGQVGTHTVKITTTSTGGGAFSLQWLGVSSQNYTTDAAAPHVVVGSIISSSSGSLNSAIAIYNSQLPTLVAALVADGLNITIAPTGTALDPSTDLRDELHPNNIGHIKLGHAFAGAL